MHYEMFKKERISVLFTRLLWAEELFLSPFVVVTGDLSSWGKNMYRVNREHCHSETPRPIKHANVFSQPIKCGSSMQKPNTILIPIHAKQNPEIWNWAFKARYWRVWLQQIYAGTNASSNKTAISIHPKLQASKVTYITEGSTPWPQVTNLTADQPSQQHRPISQHPSHLQPTTTQTQVSHCHHTLKTISS